jgi:cytochrome P450
MSAELPNFSPYSSSLEEMGELYRRLPGCCPVARSDQLGGFYMLTAHADVKRAAGAWQEFSSAGGVILPRLPFRLAALEFDPPEHDFWRGLYREVLNLATYRSFQDRIDHHARELIGAFAERGQADLVAEFTEQLPVMTICEIVGITDHDRARRARVIALEVLGARDDHARAHALGRFAEFCLEEVNARRAHPLDDYLSRIGTEPVGDVPLSNGAIVNLLTGFLIAGHHTTSSVMSSLLFEIASDGALRDRLCADRGAIGRAVEETIRLHTPVHHFFRRTTRELELHNARIPAGSEVMLSWAAANRDPRVYERPEDFDIDRPVNGRLGFGYGIHACVGAQLARLELRIALDALLDELPDIAVRAEPMSTTWTGFLEMLDRLPVSFTPAAR